MPSHFLDLIKIHPRCGGCSRDFNYKQVSRYTAAFEVVLRFSGGNVISNREYTYVITLGAKLLSGITEMEHVASVITEKDQGAAPIGGRFTN